MAKETWLTKLFKPKGKSKQGTFSEALSIKGYEPTFSSFGSSVFYSDVVYSALAMKARFFAKLEPRHVRDESGRLQTVADSDIAKLLRNPNEYQTTYDFLYQAFFIRELQDNCFIYPDYFVTNSGTRKYTGLYILLPSETPKVYDDGTGELKIGFKIDGYREEIIFKLNEIAIWKNNIEDATFLGGGKYSKNASKDLLSSLEAYHQIKQSIAEASKLACTFDGIIKINALSGEYERNKKVRDQFIQDLREGKSGIGVLDAGTEYEPLSRSLKTVDASTLQEIKENVLIHTGVTIEMLMGKFTSEDKEAFYENVIEPAAVSLGQALTKCFFSQWQQTHGDEIVLYPHKIQLMNTSEIVSIIGTTITAGVFTIDEYREMLGYAPLENGEGNARPRGFNNLDGATEVTE
jgi:HK97 family phage portal protein